VRSTEKTMERDIRHTALYREAQALFKAMRGTGTGQISDAADIHAAPDGTRVVFSGVLVDERDGSPPTRICTTELESGDTRLLTFGPNIDRLPKFSPDGRTVAFLSDRSQAGNFQLYLLDPVSGAAQSTQAVEGWVEYLHWSPDGLRILLGVAGHGADVSGAEGAVTSRPIAETMPAWMPSIDGGDENHHWRRAWVYECATGRVRQVGNLDSNIWEAVWCGSGAVAAVASSGPGEGLWYSADLRILDVSTGSCRVAYTPQAQIGWPAASPSGTQLAIVEALCSDRWIVAGNVLLIDTASGRIRRVDTSGVDITHAEWCSDRQLLLSGHRELQTVVGLYDSVSRTFTEAWSSRELSAGGHFMTVSALRDPGDCVLVGEGFKRAPEIAVIRGGAYQPVKSFDLGYAEQAQAIDAVEQVGWTAPDGLVIQGWLLRPKGEGPHPLVMNVHGGPVWHWHPAWLGRGGLPVLMLLKQGIAVFLPNPRGSTGRGQEFARRVLGDMGGADTYDYLSGLDYLVQQGIADPRRLGVMGRSYGGFMAAWLICQDTRFAAAVPVAPVTNFVTEHLISNIPHWPALFLADPYTDPNGQYFQRSPIMHAHKARTPTLTICGALDRSAPPEEAVQFHNALLENGVESVLLTYPEEGHGIRKLPAAIDYAARVASWFEEHL
jgi:dipeptidyl aminopeptidase/acylaminoacyl peptidase